MSTRKSRISAPSLTPAQILCSAESLIDEFLKIRGPQHLRHYGLRFEDVYADFIYPKYRIELVEDEPLGEDEAGKKILGRFDPAANTAFIDPILNQTNADPRRAWTLWHEVGGHGVLQGEWLRRELRRIVTVTDDSLSATTVNRLEQQANTFAAGAAAPAWFVRQVMRQMIPERVTFPFYEPCDYWLVVQGLRVHRVVHDADDLCRWIGGKINGYFGGLSAEAIGYRLKELGIVQNQSASDLHLFRRAACMPMRRAVSLAVERAFASNHAYV